MNIEKFTRHNSSSEAWQERVILTRKLEPANFEPLMKNFFGLEKSFIRRPINLKIGIKFPVQVP